MKHPIHSADFGKKEHILNYACQRYQLSRPAKVGAVMALIRECQPGTIAEWEQWYFDNASTEGNTKTRITGDSLKELGERLYIKITEVIIPEWEAAFRELTLQDCIDYIRNLAINRTYDGFVREKSVVNNVLSKIFPNVEFTESDPQLDHSGDIDYVVKVGNKALGIQVKPVTAKSNFGSYSATERMRNSFNNFEATFGGKVFIVFSLDGDIVNQDIIEQIRKEIERLSNN
jgi:hypothetical protein